jgi:tetratricopeptide (TPR) repeat protein
MHAYDAKDLRRIFGLPSSAVRSLARAGYIHPQRLEGRVNYSFQDLRVLRTVSALRAANIPTRKINRALQRLRAAGADESVFSSLSVAAMGDEVAVRDGRVMWESESGQYALPLDAGNAAEVAMMNRDLTEPALASMADEHFADGFALEDSDTVAAQSAYTACLDIEPGHAEARINLGRLLHLRGQLAEAEGVYRAAEQPGAVLAYNLALLLEDLRRDQEAIASYREAVALDPQLEDAYFNLARLCERVGDAQNSLRYLLAYRRLLLKQGL